MTPDRWRQIEAVFLGSLEHAPEGRAAFLEVVCAGDEELRREAESLLAAHESGASSLGAGMGTSNVSGRLTAIVAAAYVPGGAGGAPALAAPDGAGAGSNAPIGERLGKYKILRKLGQGGMGEVYVAKDVRLGRRVALKLPNADLQRNPYARERFVYEARAAAVLNDPHIATIHEISEADGRVFYVSELVAGETLRERIARGPVPVTQALAWAVGLCDALGEAHRHGIVHRDLKPANIMITPRGDAKLLDFGLAKHLRQEATCDTGPPVKRVPSLPGRFVGTIGYAAPEVFCGEGADERSDLFALGVILYEMLTGRTPFPGDTPSARAQAVLAAEPPPLATGGVRVPPDLERLVRKLLAKDRRERHGSADDLGAELRRLAEVASRSKPQPAWRLAVPVGVAALLVAAVAVVSLSHRPAAVRSAAARHRQLTFDGDATEPVVSPDGRRLAYRSGTTGALMLRGVDGGMPETWRDQGYPLRWSPDGVRLVVALSAVPASFSVLDGPGAERALMPSHLFLAWSADGGQVARWAVASSRIAIHLAKGDLVRSIAVPGNPLWVDRVVWSPRSERLAVLTERSGAWSVWSVAVDGGSEQRLYEDTHKLSTPAWSAAGDAVYWRREGASGGELWKRRLDAESGAAQGEPVLALGGLSLGTQYSLSGDGRSLAYVRVSTSTNIHHVTIAARDPPTDPPTDAPVTRGTSEKSFASITADGRRIAYVLRDGWRWNLMTIPAEGGAPEMVYSSENEICGPTWSPDARHLAFGARRAGIWRLVTIGARSGTPRELGRTSLSGTARCEITWSPDGRIVYQRPGNRNFHLVDPVTEKEEPLIRDETVGWASFPRFSPDGNRVAFFWNRGLWVISRPDGEARLVTGWGRLARLSPVGWSADGDWIEIAESSDDGRECRIDEVHAMSGKHRPRASLKFDKPMKWDGWRMSGDGRHLVNTEDERLTDIWEARDFDPDVAVPTATLATPPPPTTSRPSAARPTPEPPVLSALPRNLDFEEGEAGAEPPGWRCSDLSWELDPPLAAAYPCRTVADRRFAGERAAGIGGGTGQTPGSTGSIDQRVDATRYRGKTVRFRAAVRSEVTSPQGGARLFVGIWRPEDAGGVSLAGPFTASTEPITSPDWTTHEVLQEVAPDALWIQFGVRVTGVGLIWIDAASLEVVPEATGERGKTLPDARPERGTSPGAPASTGGASTPSRRRPAAPPQGA